MGRAPCCDKANVKKGPWSPEEDAKLKAYIEQFGTGGNWIALPQKIGLKRCGKSCRLRWLNYLRPNIKHGGFSEEEDNIICSLYISIGSRWSIIAAQLPGRTDNDIKNYWNTRLKKKLLGRRKDSHQARRLSPGNQEENPQDVNRMEDNPYSQTLSNSALERLQLHMQLQSIQHPFSFYNHPALWPKLHPLIGNQNGILNESPAALIQQIPQSSTGPFDQEDHHQEAFHHDHFHHQLPSTTAPIQLQRSTHDSNITAGNSKQNDEIDHNLTNRFGLNNIGGNSYPVMETAITPKSAGEDEQFNEKIQTVSSLQAELKDLIYSKTGGFEAVLHGDQTTEFDCFKEMDHGGKESMMWWANDFDRKSSSSNSWDSASHVIHPEGSALFQDYVLGYNDL